MNNRELIDDVAVKTQLAKTEVKRTIEILFGTIAAEVAAGGEVKIANFGTFRCHERKPMVGFNPRTGEKINVPMRRSAKLSIVKSLKDLLNPPTQRAARRRA
ncbi:MAG TPA: HU family DNA-binding protein [Stellaceae bacterium]|jgi:nucleoid DNA-binding protein|nr:HU family DNA-binding protein [Stellaceae bacterium]